MKRFPIILAVVIAVLSAGSVAGQEKPESHVEWAGRVLDQMLAIKVGMTRTDLEKVFEGDGGFGVPLSRTYVSRQCPYFKVDVVFEAVGRPSKDAQGRSTLVSDGRDIITKISRPYLAYPTID